MRPSTLHALELAAVLTRQDQFIEAVSIAEPVILAADIEERAEIRQWLADHADDFTSRGENG
ncbi:hypothetical protein [Streptomyces sp. NPDC059850]|uniref:hypothetical protein n=1 Tax=Streptomyces sp. NPDC059850 TaxID=3346970 RepID=UPI00365D2832